MIYANNHEGKKIKASPDKRARCPGCNTEVIPKCGDIIIWHWAHQHKPDSCMYKPTTLWHLLHQMNAEIEGWEIEKRIEGFIVDDYRIADCFKKNNVIELQKSSISDKEILHRNIFYNAHNFNIHWVFDFTDKEELFLNFYNDTDLGFKQNHPRKSILILFNYIPNQNKPIWGNVFLQIGEDEYIQVKKMYTDEEGRGNGNGWGKIVNQKQMFKLCSMRTKR